MRVNERSERFVLDRDGFRGHDISRRPTKYRGMATESRGSIVERRLRRRRKEICRERRSSPLQPPNTLPSPIRKWRRLRKPTLTAAAGGGELPAIETLESNQRGHILAALEKTGGVIDGPYGAAKILALNPDTLRSRMKKLGIGGTRRHDRQ